MENKDLINVLEKEIETRILPGKNYPYIPAAAIRSRLNEVFGGRWDTRVVSSEVINDDTILILLELVCSVGENKIVKEGFGSAPIHKYSSGVNKGKPVNLGDAYGNSLMDALKSCSKQLGIGNREMDVKKDPRTGKYVWAGNDNSSTSDNVISVTQKQDQPPNEKINELKKKLEANKNKDKPFTKLKEPVVEKEDDVPISDEPTPLSEEDTKKAKLLELKKKLKANKAGAVTKPEPEPKSELEPEPEPKSELEPEPKSKPESDKTLPESWSSDVITKSEPKSEFKSEPDANPDDIRAAKIIELKKKLKANKTGAVTKPEPEPVQESKPEEIEPGYGFDYDGVGNSDSDVPKNTQKLVILNLAKMQKLTPEEYINKALGKKKAIDELTAEEAGQVVRAGLSKFE